VHPGQFAKQGLHLKKIGIFGGTFDPIHHGHLILAREAREALGLDVVILVPAAASPHKLDQKLTAPWIRLEMLRAALEREPGLECDELELHRPPPSYAIDTAEALRFRNPTAEFFYLIGDDNLGGLPTWHRFAELSGIVRFVVLARSNMNTENPYPTIRRRLDISATDIRNRVATDRSIRYLVPPAIEKIIRDRRLYREHQNNRGTPSQDLRRPGDE
jgi:nicotinate-nucleotide adenylyltransferase